MIAIKTKEFDRLVKQVANGRCAHFLHPDLKNRLGLMDKPYSLATQNPLPSDSRVLESEVAKSLNFELSAHTNNPTIANFDDKSIAQSKQQSQGKVDKKTKSKSKSKSNDFGMGM